MKKFIVILSRAVGLHSLLVSHHRSRLISAGEAMKRCGTETTMPVLHSARFQHHQRALLRLGFLMEREFALARRAIGGPVPYRAFCDLLRARFPDGYWSCAASGSRITVTAPTSQIPEWEQFLSAYDLQAG